MTRRPTEPRRARGRPGGSPAGRRRVGRGPPEDDAAAVEVLADALATVRASADSYLDDLRRVAAEFENFRKRAAREREETVARASQRLVENLLPVLDSFDSAFAHQAQTPASSRSWRGARHVPPAHGHPSPARAWRSSPGLERTSTRRSTKPPR